MLVSVFRLNVEPLPSAYCAIQVATCELAEAFTVPGIFERGYWYGVQNMSGEWRSFHRVEQMCPHCGVRPALDAGLYDEAEPCAICLEALRALPWAVQGVRRILAGEGVTTFEAECPTCGTTQHDRARLGSRALLRCTVCEGVREFEPGELEALEAELGEGS